MRQLPFMDNLIRVGNPTDTIIWILEREAKIQSGWEMEQDDDHQVLTLFTLSKLRREQQRRLARANSDRKQPVTDIKRSKFTPVVWIFEKKKPTRDHSVLQG